jgi:hypothetical protein
MARDDEDFLRRWSRRKLDAAKAPSPAPETPVPLPSLDSLSFESDFKAFMQAKVEDGVKRAALKKLFSDPRFNLMDGLDVYIDDYSKDDPIPQALLAQLEHAKSTLFGRDEEKPKEPPQPEQQEIAQVAEEPKKDKDGAAG